MSIVWSDDRRREATGDDAAKDIQRAAAAAKDVLADHYGNDREVIARVAGFLNDLKRALTARILGGQGLTSFKRASLQALLDDTDRLIRETQKRMTAYAGDAIESSADLGLTYATAPIEGAGLTIQARLPGLDAALVDTTFRATASLLTAPMRQYADEVKRSVRRVALAGETQFEEMKRLAKVIDDRGDVAMFKAERIIRTEVGRVFNEATYQRASDLSKEFPFLVKGWRAANDKRTRKGHQEAGAVYSRGEGLIPFHQPFRLRVYDERSDGAVKLLGMVTLRFPIDPEATPAGRLAAGATIMCRCNAFIDFDPRLYREFTKRRLTAILGEPPAPPPPPPTPDDDPTPTSQAPPPPPAVVPDTTITPARRFKPAADVRKEIAELNRTSPEGQAITAAQKRLDKVGATTKDLFDQLRGIQDRLTQAMQADGQGNVYARVARAMDLDPEVAKLRQQQADARKALVAATAARDAAKRTLAARARALVEVDPTTRPKVTAEWASSGGRADLRTNALNGIEAFERLVGVDVAAGKFAGKVKVKFFSGRSNYLGGQINMGTADLGVIVHELGHWLEDAIPAIHEQAVAFLVRRTKGQKTQSMNDIAKIEGKGGGYKRDERATKDGFLEGYTGKWYTLPKTGAYAKFGPYDAKTPEQLTKWVQYTEVVSMGLQKMYEDPVAFQSSDPDFFDFIYNLARGVSTESFPEDPADWNHVPGLKKQDPASKGKKG